MYLTKEIQNQIHLWTTTPYAAVNEVSIQVLSLVMDELRTALGLEALKRGTASI